MTWLNIMAVFLGSGLGGVCRFLVSKAIQSHVGAWAFPWGTFAVNVAGCFLIGLFYGIFDRFLPPSQNGAMLRLLLATGFCGGFTTFSTFINENYLLFQSANIAMVLGYVALSVVVGLALIYCGYAIARI